MTKHAAAHRSSPTQYRSAGNGTYSTSAGFTTAAAGTYHWIATYSGDASNIGVSSICANEAVVIDTDNTDDYHNTESYQWSGRYGAQRQRDPYGRLSTRPGPSPSTLYGVGDQTCGGAPIFTNTVPVSGNGTYSTSAGFTTAAAGTYHWIATYSGDASNVGVSSICANEAVVITLLTPRISTTPNPTQWSDRYSAQ